MGSDAAAAQRQSPPCLEHHSFIFLTAIPVFSNRLTELNLREVYQMVMPTVDSYMKYLTYSGLHKIVHLHRDLRDLNRCPWGRACKFHVGQLPDWVIQYPAVPYPHNSVQGC